MNSSFLPSPTEIEVDKRNNEWVLTYWLRSDLTLRLRIQHWNECDPDEFICEVSNCPAGIDPTFRELGRFHWAAIELSPNWKIEPDFRDWPMEWRYEFVRLARVWAVLNDLAEWGPALGDGQAAWEAQLAAGPRKTPGDGAQ